MFMLWLNEIIEWVHYLMTCQRGAYKLELRHYFCTVSATRVIPRNLHNCIIILQIHPLTSVVMQKSVTRLYTYQFHWQNWQKHVLGLLFIARSSSNKIIDAYSENHTKSINTFINTKLLNIEGGCKSKSNHVFCITISCIMLFRSLHWSVLHLPRHKLSKFLHFCIRKYDSLKTLASSRSPCNKRLQQPRTTLREGTHQDGYIIWLLIEFFPRIFKIFCFVSLNSDNVCLTSVRKNLFRNI